MTNVLGAIEAWADKQPEKPLYSFLDFGGNEIASFTYATFLRRVGIIAGYLSAEHRLMPGDRVILAYPPGLEVICAFFACVRAGLIPVPVPPPVAQGFDLALFRMENIARDCRAVAVLTSPDCLARVRARKSADGELTASLGEQRWIVTEEMQMEGAPAPDARSSDILFLQYTSGSTSDPKGVIVGHDNILTNAKLILDHDDLVTVCWLPHHHDMGLIGYYINTALGGGTMHGFAPAAFIQRPALWLETISNVHATASSAPNFAFELCLRKGVIPPSILENLDLSSLRVLMAAAEPIKPTVFRSFLQAFRPYGLKPESFMVAYGLAENTLCVSSYGRQILSLNKRALARGHAQPTEEISEVGAATHLVSCGRPLGDNVVVIVDPETARPVNDGEVGEIWVTGRSKCLGYWEDAEASQATFSAELAGDSSEPRTRHLRTGDMGFLREGEVYVCGRRKDMLIVRGQNYYPQDIEAIVEQARGIRRNGVAAVEYENDGEQEIVILAEISGSRVTADPHAVIAAVRTRLSIEIDRIVFISPMSLPKTSSGKLMRFRARQMWRAGEFKVASEHASAVVNDRDAWRKADETPFGFFKAKYRLTGNETYSLMDAGLDSLDMVLFLHEITELLSKHGARDLVDTVDIRILERVSIADLFGLAARIDSAPAGALAEVGAAVSTLERARRAEEYEMMTVDRRLSFLPTPHATLAGYGAAREVLLTGATGFLGPFLLTSLLELTEAKIHALVRAESPAHATQRVREAVAQASRRSADFWEAFERRVVCVPGDLEKANLGLDSRVWGQFATNIDTIYHNGAIVNYLHSYRRMRAANVQGTNEIVRLAFDGQRKVFNYISTTFIFGWAKRDILFESDANDEMELLDFGYSQSKWVSEHVVADASRRGLIARIYRPALVTPATNGDGANFDITIRLLAFMVKHGIGVDALNQVSFLPADVAAHNMVAISNVPETAHGVYHVTRDEYANMKDITDIITRLTGRRFEIFDLHAFVPEVIRRCTRDDLLFPLLDFLVGSVDNISSMEFKRYNSDDYQRARSASRVGIPDPSLTDTVTGMLNFMRRTGIVDLPDYLPTASARLGENVS